MGLNNFKTDYFKNKKFKVIFYKKRIDSEFTIVLTNDLSIVYLNKTSNIILNLIENNQTVFEIFNYFFEKYPLIDKDILISDILNSIRTMQWKKIIK